MSGSVAPNVPVTIYGELIREAAARGVRSLLDTSGELLRTAVAECPFALRLNRAESSQLVARELNSIDALVDAAQSFLSYGFAVVVVSLGAKRAVDAVGAGDVMTARETDAGLHITRISGLNHTIEFLQMVKAQQLDWKAVVYLHRPTDEILAVLEWTAADEREYLKGS
jgi:hypothetical protein